MAPYTDLAGNKLTLSIQIKSVPDVFVAVYGKSFLENHQESPLLMMSEMCVQISHDSFISVIALFSPIRSYVFYYTRVPQGLHSIFTRITL